MGADVRHAQQVRALNLVDAILSRNILPKSGRVAIIGAGAAGITAAVALARAAPKLKVLDLFERRSDVLEFQYHSTRYLHPHFYDWPGVGSTNPDAALPLMNWIAGTGGQVAASLRSQFDEVRRSSVLTFHPDTIVTGLNPSTTSTVRVIIPTLPAVGKIYDVVILAIGFGLEAHLDHGETPSYWAPSQMSAPILTHQAQPLVFVSGNGDGGLVDFLMAAFNAMEHAAICELIQGLDLGPALAELQVIEELAWQADGEGLDIIEAYRTRVRQLVPQAVWQTIIANLRPNVRIHLHTRETMLFRRTTALHNRVAVFLVIEADHSAGHNLITVTTGISFEGPLPVSGEITLTGAAPFTPYRRFLRLGPDSAQNLAPFNNVLSTFPQRVRASAVRPESPQLSAAARSRFELAAEAFAGVNVPAVAPLPAAVARNQVVLRSHGDAIEWLGTFGPTEAASYWAEQHSLMLYTETSAADADALLSAVARLGAHANNFVIHARDVNGWRAAMSNLCAARALPGPDLVPNCMVQSWVEPPALASHVTMVPTLLAESIHFSLDGEMLGRLRTALYEILGPAAAEMGWPIEATLKGLLWAKWEDWYQALLRDSVACRRFLLLLATETDGIDPTAARMVRVGPTVLKPYLTKPALFGLSFAACSIHAVVPAGGPPGNVSAQGITGHACGVGWIDGRELGASRAIQHNWTTGIVLLSQLKDAIQLIESHRRFDREAGDPAKVGTTSLAEEPLLVGADAEFVNALEAGVQNVRDYFQSILAWREGVAAPRLETEPLHG